MLQFSLPLEPLLVMISYHEVLLLALLLEACAIVEGQINGYKITEWNETHYGFQGTLELTHVSLNVLLKPIGKRKIWN